MIKLSKDALRKIRLIDLIILGIILILFVYDGFISKINSKWVWLIAAALMFISLAVKIGYIIYNKKKRKILE